MGDLDLIVVNHQISIKTMMYLVSKKMITWSKDHIERINFDDPLRELSLWVSCESLNKCIVLLLEAC